MNLKSKHNTGVMDIDFADGADVFAYNSSQSLHDYDIIVWQPVGLNLVFCPANISHGIHGITNAQYKSLLYYKEKRDREFEEFLIRGGLLVVFSPEPFKFQSDSIRSLDIDEIIPFLPPPYSGSGAIIKFKGKKIYEIFWRKIEKYFHYKSIYNETDKDLEPFLFTKASDNSFVGFVRQVGKGHIIYLPELNFTSHHKTEENQLKVMSILDAVEELYLALNGTPEIIEPSWVKSINLPGELESSQKIKNYKDEILKIRKTLATEMEQLHLIQKDKILLFGQGDLLAAHVKDVLNEIGISAQKGPEGRDDLILQYGDQIGVAEVTGTKKSASEEKAAQLEKWVSNHLIKNQKHAKPFLIVNAYREVALEKRSEPAFPAQMLEYTKDRKHCLITTTQLLTILITIRMQPEKREEIINQLFNTVGVLEGYDFVSS